ncbi:MAG: hypothetical protein WBN50_07645 [Lutimonas sp.]
MRYRKKMITKRPSADQNTYGGLSCPIWLRYSIARNLRIFFLSSLSCSLKEAQATVKSEGRSLKGEGLDT